MQHFQHANIARQGKQTKLDLNRFKPVVPMARRTVDDLIKRGSVLIMVKSDQVQVQRMGTQTATIDALGRVQWGAASPRL